MGKEKAQSEWGSISAVELKEVAYFGTSPWAVYLSECKVGHRWTVKRMKTILLRAVIDSPDVSSYYIFHVCCHNVKPFFVFTTFQFMQNFISFFPTTSYANCSLMSM